MLVAIGASSFAEENEEIMRVLLSKGIEIRKNPYGRRLTKEEIIEHLQGAEGLLAGLEPLDQEVFDKCPDLRAIARIGIGMDNVDLDAAKKTGIKVSNTPDGPTEAVAEMTLTAMLALLHNLNSHNMDVHEGIWKKQIGKSITEVTVFVIGYGHIGKRVANMLTSLGARILVYDKYNTNNTMVSLEDGISQADVITIHASGAEEIITKEMFCKMRKGVFILNSARGGLINEDALYDALNNGIVDGFWGDALWSEPYHGKLSKCKNAILTPHISTYTTKCRNRMEMQAVENLLCDLGK